MPLPVLIGIFLYMGVVSMLGLQFVQRIAMLFMPVKYQVGEERKNFILTISKNST